MKKDQPIRILLVDDHQVLRDGLRVLIESEEDLTVVGEADSSEAAIRFTIDTPPDVIVMDLGMPGMSGIDAIREIRSKNTVVRIVVLSMHIGRKIVRDALEAGSDGYVPKSSAHSSLLQAIRVVHSGERYLHPKAASALVDSIQASNDERAGLDLLSERELDVIRLTAMGFVSREIGDKLALSPKTVETYRQRAMEKLNLVHRSDIVRFALSAGLLDSLDENDL